MKKKIFFLCFSLFILHFSSATAQNDWLWGTAGIGRYSEITSLASDNKGNCLAAGFCVRDTVYWGSYSLVNTSYQDWDFFLLKLDPTGNILWAKQTISLSNKSGENSGMTTDKKGNIYYTVSLTDTMIIAPDTLINKLRSGFNCTSYLAKYDPNGNVVWAKQAVVKNDSSSIVGEAVSTDLKGNCFVTGFFGDTVSIGGYILSTPNHSLGGDAFIAKYDSNGNVKWAEQSTDKANWHGADPLSIANDRYGNTFITGEFADTVVFGSYTLSVPPPRSYPVFFITKYDSNGNVQWAKQSITSISGGSYGIAITTDIVGNAYVLGGFIDTIVFGGNTLIGPNSIASQFCIFLVKYAPNGNVVWAKQLEVMDSNSWEPYAISIDKYNHIYMEGGGGIRACKIKFGDTTFHFYDTAKYDAAAFVLKLDSNANVLCAGITTGGGLDIYTGAIASDSSGNYVYFGSTSYTPMIFGKDTLNPFKLNAEMPFVARWGECEVGLGVNTIRNYELGITRVYPNPNNGKFTLEYDLGIETSGNVKIYNTMGEMVGEYALSNSQGKMSISNPELSNGVYIWKLYTEKEVVKIGKVIIIK